VRNIFILPFQRNVWIAIAVFLTLIFCLLYLSIKWEYYQNKNTTKSADYWKQLNPSEQTVSDNLFILLGAFSQQGTMLINFDLSILFENNKKKFLNKFLIK